MKRGWSLPELLIAMGVVAALAGIGIPLFRTMRAQAHQASCVNQLRGLGASMEVYLTDHSNFFPDMRMGRKTKSGSKNVLEEVLLPYTGGPEYFRCPADHEDFEETGCSYFWNHHASGLRKNMVRMFGTDATESQIPLIHDKEAYHGDENGTNFLFMDMSAGKDLNFEVDSE